MDGTQEYNQYLIPRLDQNKDSIKDGYLATVVCADVWNSNLTNDESLIYPASGSWGDVFVFRANKSVEFGNLSFYGWFEYSDYFDTTSFFQQYDQLEFHNYNMIDK